MAKAAKEKTQINGTRLSTMKRQKAKNEVEIEKKRKKKENQTKPKTTHKTEKVQPYSLVGGKKGKSSTFSHVA